MEFLRRFRRLPLIDRVLLVGGPVFLTLGYLGIGWLVDLTPWALFAIPSLLIVFIGLAYLRWWRPLSVSAVDENRVSGFSWRDWVVPGIVMVACATVILVIALTM